MPIGEWVLDRAARDLAAWRKGSEVTVSVNVAPIQLRDPTFAKRVAAIFAAHGVPPTALTLEITERVLLDDRPAYMRAMAELRAARRADRARRLLHGLLRAELPARAFRSTC